MSEDRLKPCPFCGSKANMIEDDLLSEIKYGVGCSNHDCLIYTGYGVKLHKTELEAITAWNRRYYSPIRWHPMPYEKWTTVLLPEIAWPSGGTWPDFLSVALDEDGEWHEYVPERTCHMKYVPEWSGDELYPTECYRCETCGYVSQDGQHRYCAGCGAKAMDE